MVLEFLQNTIVKLNNRLIALEQSGSSINKQVLTISANSSGTAAVIDGVRFDECVIDVKVLDNDSNSRTYNTYVNSEAIATVSVAVDGSELKIYNDDSIDHDFLVTIVY